MWKLQCYPISLRKDVYKRQRWGHAVRTGKEIFRIGMSQPDKDEPVESNKKTEKSQKSQKSQQTKKKSAPKGNYKR